jgi:hypothetical protein
MLFVASFAMGLFNAACPFCQDERPKCGAPRRRSLITALIWAAVLALLFGGSIFTRDLTENRLAFDFRLPVRPGAIWAARLLAAIVTIALAAALVLAPSALFGMDFASAAAGLDVLIGIEPGGVGVPSRSFLAFAPIAALALLLLANPAALAARARQSWAGVDLFSVGIVSLAATWGWQLLELWEARTALWRASALVATLALLGAVVASFIQISRGRTEPDRAQKSLSLTLFAAAFATGSAALVYANWYVRPPLSSPLRIVFVESGTELGQLAGRYDSRSRLPGTIPDAPSLRQSASPGAGRSVHGLRKCPGLARRFQGCLARMGRCSHPSEVAPQSARPELSAVGSDDDRHYL